MLMEPPELQNMDVNPCKETTPAQNPTACGNCQDAAAQKLSAIRGGLLDLLQKIWNVILGCLLVILSLPAALLTLLQYSLIVLIEKLCGKNSDTAKRFRLFFFGSSDPTCVAESTNRQIRGDSEALRGQGLMQNLWYTMRNEHPLVSICLADFGHPYSPFARISMFVLLQGFGFFVVAFSENKLDITCASVPIFSLDFVLKFLRSTLGVTLPQMAMEIVVKHVGLASYRSKVPTYFEKMQRDRIDEYCTKFIESHHLAKVRSQKLEEKHDKPGLCDDCCDCNACCNSCCNAMEDAIRDIIAQIFSGLAWTMAAVFIWYGSVYGGQVCISSCFDATISFVFLTSPLKMVMLFYMKWKYQHCFLQKRMELFGNQIPPLPEALEEFQQFFRLIDESQDGHITGEEMHAFVTKRCHKNLVFNEDAWQKLLSQMDADADCQLSLKEMRNGLLKEFCREVGWWLPECMDGSTLKSSGLQESLLDKTDETL